MTGDAGETMMLFLTYAALFFALGAVSYEIASRKLKENVWDFNRAVWAVSIVLVLGGFYSFAGPGGWLWNAVIDFQSEAYCFPRNHTAIIYPYNHHLYWAEYANETTTIKCLPPYRCENQQGTEFKPNMTGNDSIFYRTIFNRSG